MKKRLMILIAIIVLLIGGIFTFLYLKENRINSDAIRFKEEYESLNGKENSSGKEYRTITIAKANPFVYITSEELVQKIENGETFYVYFGSKLCPWCRSVIEKMIEVAKEKKIEKIYYVDIWDEEGNEILRDKYVLEEGIPKIVVKGTESYYKLLNCFEEILLDYSLTDENNNEISTNEKRIYAPSFIYVKNGKALKLTEGISSKQTDSRAKLTEEILKEEEDLFHNFLDN